MNKVVVFIASLLAGFTLLTEPARATEFVPKAEKVVDNVYAIVGPLGQRSKENDGSNANFGFIVTAQVLSDGGGMLPPRTGQQDLAAS